jgi:hypothetical protein
MCRPIYSVVISRLTLICRFVMLCACVLNLSMFILIKITLHRIVLITTQFISIHLTTATCFKPVYGFINPQALEYKGNYLNNAAAVNK